MRTNRAVATGLADAPVRYARPRGRHAGEGQDRRASICSRTGWPSSSARSRSASRAPTSSTTCRSRSTARSGSRAPAPVETVVKMRDVEVPAGEAAPGNLQDDLAGKKVTLHFKGDNRPPVVGTMMKLKPAKPDEAAAPGAVPVADGEGPRLRRAVGGRVGRGRGRRRQGHAPPAAAVAHARRTPTRPRRRSRSATSRTGCRGRRATGSTSPTRRRSRWNSTRSSATNWPTSTAPKSG